MILHTLNQPPTNTACLNSCLEAMQPEDTLLLIEDGVYWALPAVREQLKEIDPNRLCALTVDVQARGISGEGITLVDDKAFVALCVEHEKVVSWF